MVNFEYIKNHEKEIKELFNNSSFFYPEKIEDISSRIEHNNGIRLFCTRNVYRGDISVIKNIVKVMKLLKANHFQFHDNANNFWLDFYYILSEKELNEIKKFNLLKQLNELENG
jgi:hypothetical protein